MNDNPYSEPALAETVPQPRNKFLYGCGGVVAIILVGMAVLVLLLPFQEAEVREGRRRTQCRNNLKHIGLALHNYHDEHGMFPPAYTVDETGRRLHSWRTLILPYLEQKALYSNIDLSKPWDDPANLAAYETNIEAYRCPSTDVAPFHATYLGLVGPDLFFNSSEPRNIRAITDGTSNTLMVVEVAEYHAVHWMSPLDADKELLLNIGQGTDFPHTGGFQAALADGSVRFLSEKIAAETLSALMTVAGGETIGEF